MEKAQYVLRTSHYLVQNICEHHILAAIRIAHFVL